MRRGEMARRLNIAIAAGAALALGVTGCSSPSSNNDSTNGGGSSSAIATQVQSTDPNAKGPAKDVPGSRKGGVINILAQATPNTFDPTDTYYQDSLAIAKLLYRTP